jgi:hypothetical protein
MNRKTRRAFANKLAKKGFAIFRVNFNEKTPFSSGWQKEAKPDATPWINENANYNIGILCGGWLLVVDIDMKDQDGEKAWKKLCKKLGIKESLFQIRTPSGGRHLYYIIPDGLIVPNSASKIAPGVDIRCTGGYVVGPGSVINGVAYEVINVGAEMLPAPQALIDVCGKGKKRDDKHDVPVGELDTQVNIDRAEENLKFAPVSVEGAGGDHNAFAVAARVREMGISEGRCLDLMMGHWNNRCVPPWSGEELEVKVRNAYSYATSRIGADTPEAQFADDPDSGPVTKRELSRVKRFNQKYAYVAIGTSHIIVEEYMDDDGRIKTAQYGERTFHGMTVADTYLDGDGKLRYMSKEWIMNKDRRTFRGFTFDPKQVGSIAASKYNHWRGFIYEPLPIGLKEAKKKCDLYLKHIRDVICGGNMEHYSWVMNHFSQLLQTPWKKPETAIVVVGEKGAGKSLIFDVIGMLAKDNYVLTADKRMLLGSFNSHMETALVFQFEEAFWAGDKAAEGKLKLLITGKHHMVERKGYEPYMVGNYARIYITSNNDWAIPATVDERRFAVFECLSNMIGDKAYFNAIYAQLNADGGLGYRALMTVLMGIHVDQTAVHVPPKTEALADQKMETLDHPAKWLHAALEEGRIDGLDTGFEDGLTWLHEARCSEVYETYISYSKEQGGNYRISSTSFGKKLSKMLEGAVKRIRKSKKGKEGYYYQFESLDKCRENFSKWFGHDIDW